MSTTTAIRALTSLTLKDGTILPRGAVHPADSAEASTLIKAGKAVPVKPAAPEPKADAKP
jgi:hypothetical protein